MSQITIDLNKYFDLVDTNQLIRELKKRNNTHVIVDLLQGESDLKLTQRIDIEKEIIMDPEDIIRLVLNFYNQKREVIFLNRVRYEYTKTQQIIMYFIKEYTKLTLKSIGKIMQRNHSTVIYSLRVVEDMMFTDKKYYQEVKEIKSRLLELHRINKSISMDYNLMRRFGSKKC